jgi:hypothetical protein
MRTCDAFGDPASGSVLESWKNLPFLVAGVSRKYGSVTLRASERLPAWLILA